jgi:hypothetical protein
VLCLVLCFLVPVTRSAPVRHDSLDSCRSRHDLKHSARYCAATVTRIRSRREQHTGAMAVGTVGSYITCAAALTVLSEALRSILREPVSTTLATSPATARRSRGPKMLFRDHDASRRTSPSVSTAFPFFRDRCSAATMRHGESTTLAKRTHLHVPASRD